MGTAVPSQEPTCDGFGRLSFRSSRSLASAFAGSAGARAPEADVAAWRNRSPDAPATGELLSNTTGDPTDACEDREKVSAFKKLSRPTRPAPSPPFRTLRRNSHPRRIFSDPRASQSKEKAFVPALKKLASSHKGDEMSTWASEAINVIENGKCSKTRAQNGLVDICQ